jgi:hypothetical protein
MKKEDIEKAQEGELEKVTGFQYVPGNICRIDLEMCDGTSLNPDPSPEDCCPRCWGSGVKTPIEGREFCPECGMRIKPI